MTENYLVVSWTVLTFRLAPSRAMTPVEQLDIIRVYDAVERTNKEEVSKRDLEVKYSSHYITQYVHM